MGIISHFPNSRYFNYSSTKINLNDGISDIFAKFNEHVKQLNPQSIDVFKKGT